jgi:hypothetical protein
MGDLAPVGGFQSGFHARTVPRAKARFPQFLICDHACERVVQLVSHVSGEVELELCAREAAHLGKVLLIAASVGARPGGGS